MRPVSRPNASPRRSKAIAKGNPGGATGWIESGLPTRHAPVNHWIYVYYPTAKRHEVSVESVAVTQAEYKHDIAVVTIRQPKHNFAYHRSGTPVVIKWGFSAHKTQVFYGYVHHVTPTHGTDRHTLNLVCIGASYKMKHAKQKIYKKMRDSDIARHIVHDFRLRGDIQRSNRFHQQYPTHGKTAWEILVKLAKESGYTLFCHQHVVHFHSRDRDMRRLAKSAPQFWSANAVGSPHDRRKINVFKFSATFDESSETHDIYIGSTSPTPPAGSRSQTILDHTTGKVQTISDDPCSDPRKRASTDLTQDDLDFAAGDFTDDSFDTFDIIEDDSARDAYTVQQTLAGIQRLTKYKYHAKMHAGGNIRVRQGMPIYLHIKQRMYQGLWYVSSVTHNVSRHGYTMELNLLRDSYSTKYEAPPALATRPDPSTDDDIDLSPEEELQQDQDEPELIDTWDGSSDCSGDDPGDVSDPIWGAPWLPVRPPGPPSSGPSDNPLGNPPLQASGSIPVQDLPCFVKHRLKRFK